MKGGQRENCVIADHKYDDEDNQEQVGDNEKFCHCLP